MEVVGGSFWVLFCFIEQNKKRRGRKTTLVLGDGLLYSPEPKQVESRGALHLWQDKPRFVGRWQFACKLQYLVSQVKKGSKNIRNGSDFCFSSFGSVI